MIDQEAQDYFYKHVWQSNIHLFKHSGENLVKEINKHKPKFVIDAGCALNFFKGKIPNLVGYDPVFKEADIICGHFDAPFKPECADVILALGSINFGDEDLINKQFKEMLRVSKPGAIIYFRVMPEHNLNPYYPWTIEKVIQKTLEFNLSYIQEPKFIDRRRRSYLEHDLRTGERSLKRIFCQWKVNK